MARRSYTDQERARALELYREHGPAEAERRCGVPKKTISSWAARAGVQTDAPERTRAAIEQARLGWEQRRAGLADRLGEVAELLVGKIEEESAADARRHATVVGIFVEKAELLTGRATGRDERVVIDEIDQTIDRILSGAEKPHGNGRAASR